MSDDDLYEIIERGNKTIPTDEDDRRPPQPEPEPKRGPGRPKGSGNRKQKAPSDAKLGSKQIAGNFSAATAQQLKIIAAENFTTMQALLVEGINMVFREYGKPEIAGVAENDERSE